MAFKASFRFSCPNFFFLNQIKTSHNILKYSRLCVKNTNFLSDNNFWKDNLFISFQSRFYRSNFLKLWSNCTGRARMWRRPQKPVSDPYRVGRRHPEWPSTRAAVEATLNCAKVTGKSTPCSPVPTTKLTFSKIEIKYPFKKFENSNYFIVSSFKNFEFN